jgi:hypothetical protein
VAYHNKSNENQLTGSTTERGKYIQKQHSNTVSLLSSAEKKPGSKRKFLLLGPSWENAVLLPPCR